MFKMNEVFEVVEVVESKAAGDCSLVEAFAGQAEVPHVGEGEGPSYKEQELIGKSRRSTTRAVGDRWTLRA